MWYTYYIRTRMYMSAGANYNEVPGAPDPRVQVPRSGSPGPSPRIPRSPGPEPRVQSFANHMCAFEICKYVYKHIPCFISEHTAI